MTELYHVTHCDSDALGCAIIAKTPDVAFCDYDNVDLKVAEILKILMTNGAAEMLISDIAPKDEVIELVDDFNKSQNHPRVFLVDHHRTTAHLSKYSWVLHGSDSASKLLLNAIRDGKIPFQSYSFRYARDFSHSLDAIVDAIDAYDTWKSNSPHFQRGSNIAKLQKFLGIKKIFSIFQKDLFFDLGEIGRFVLETLDEKEAEEIKKAIEKTYVTHRDENEKTFVVLATGSPTVSHRVLEHLGFDYVVVPSIAFNSVSLYANGKRDVSYIAKKFGGGGHANAAGFPFAMREFVENLCAAKIRGEIEAVTSRKKEF